MKPTILFNRQLHFLKWEGWGAELFKIKVGAENFRINKMDIRGYQNLEVIADSPIPTNSNPQEGGGGGGGMEFRS